MPTRLTKPKSQIEEQSLELTLRPKCFEEYIGQEKVKQNLRIAIEAAQKRKEPIEHILLYGQPGLGKTTLAHIIARELKVNIKITSGPAIERSGDLAAILTNLENGDILFIDEIHRLNKIIEEVLYPALEEFCLDIILGKGPSAKTLRLPLPRFTLIGATTKISLLSNPLRDRFGMVYHLNFYETAEIEKILARSGRILNIKLQNAAIKELAGRSRFTPRLANRLLKRTRDLAQVKNINIIDLDLCQEAMQILEVDKYGLDAVDRSILETIITKFNGGPVGLSTLASATLEEMATLEDIYEPFLMRIGFLNRTSRGRMATEAAYRHLGFKPPTDIQKRLI